jgi:hypothetical protein
LHVSTLYVFGKQIFMLVPGLEDIATDECNVTGRDAWAVS